MNALHPFLKEAGSSLLSSLFDGDPICPADRCYDNAREMIRRCRAETDHLMALKEPINRNDFIAGSYRLAGNSEVEHLVVGLGSKHGNTVKVSHVYHGVGGTHSVSVPDWLTRAIQSHVESGFGHEALVLHNHPANPLNAIFDNWPLASSADRAMMLRNALRPLTAIKSLLGGGKVRFLLAENGYVREFRTPNLLTLWQQANAALAQHGTVEQ